MYRTTLLIVLITNFAATSDALLCNMGQVHTTGKRPSVWLISDRHNYYSNPHWEQWRETERQQHDCIRKCVSEYNEQPLTIPLTIFMEGAGYKQFRCYSHTQLVEDLPAYNTPRVAVIDFDIRRFLVVAIESFLQENPDLTYHHISLYGDRWPGAAGIDTGEVTFAEVWNEIESYGNAISYACKTYLKEEYERALPVAILQKLRSSIMT